MASYSHGSEAKLDTAVPWLQTLFNAVVTFYDNTIIQVGVALKSSLQCTTLCPSVQR